MNLRILIALFLSCIFASMLFVPKASASNLIPISLSFSLEKKPSIGAIVSRDQDGFRLTNVKYDTQLTGVVVETSDLIMKYEADVPGVFTDRYIVDGGEANVLVNDTNGIVKKGDYITASDRPGEGMKADRDGIVLGIAVEDMIINEGSATAMVLVAIDPRFSTLDKSLIAEDLILKYGIFGPIIKAILDIFQVAPEKLAQTPPIFRYTLSILLLIVTILFGFVLFGRVALRGIESLGRNPLARWTILSGIVINITFVTIMIAFALFLSYIILTI